LIESVKAQFMSSYKLPLLFFILSVVNMWGSLIYPQNKQPNIIFIYTDDQAYWSLGASGNSNAYTPNLDRLAREGAYLSNSFVTTPVCSPARASIMTSRYASEYGILDFIPQPGHKLYNASNPIGLDPSSGGKMAFGRLD